MDLTSFGKKGEPDAEGYFTLQNSGEPKVLTAINESSLEIKSNISGLNSNHEFWSGLQQSSVN